MFQKKSEKKSLVITIVLNVLLLLVLFFFGMTYFDPPKENGIAINFGTSDVGSGNVQPTKPVQTAPKQETTPEESNPQPEQSQKAQDEAVTQNTEQAPVINKDDNKIKSEEVTKPKKEIKPTEKPEKEPKKDKPKKTPDPKPEKSTSDAVNSILNGEKSEGEAQQGEGNDNQNGDKGDPDGDPNASSYYGQGKGIDGDGNYRLGGRKALNKKKYVQDCNETGTVVVEIKVNRQGKVIHANPGAKGTTNTSNCLMNPAKRAALATKFNSDANAPSIQTGFIIYEFKLSD